MSNGEEFALLAKLLVEIKHIQTPRGAAQQSYDDCLTNLENEGDMLEDRERSSKCLITLIHHAHQAWQLQLQYFSSLMFTLAEATRKQPPLRTLFGSQPASSHVSYQSILHVTICVLASQGDDCDGLYKSCLRLVANCCADNNINRRFVLEHDVMKSLIDFAIRRIEINTLIPAIYNICNDYQDPQRHLAEADESNVGEGENLNGEANAVGAASFAIHKLAADLSTEPTIFQVLLTLRSRCAEDRLSMLAELAEMATVPVQREDGPVQVDKDTTFHWDFEVNGQQHDTLDAAQLLAESDSECRVHVIRAILNLLSSDDLCRSLLHQGNSSIWKLIQLASSEKGVNIDDMDDFAEDLAECRKQFLKLFYRLIVMPEFVSVPWASDKLLDECITTLSMYFDHPGSRPELSQSPQNQIFITCCVIMLAQLASLESLREQMLSREVLTQILQNMLAAQNENDLLYPTVTLVGRLSLTAQSRIPFIQPMLLRQMRNIVATEGRGLILPFETVHTLRVMIRKRIQYLPLYFSGSLKNEDSIVSAVVVLFDKTIEAGTKLEVGHFVIDILRIIFPSAKERDSANKDDDTTISTVVLPLLDTFALKFAEILTFVCTQAEPTHQRVHGWFGLGMLSVWKQGRDAIVHFVEEGSLGTAILEVADGIDGPTQRNLKVMLSKVHECQQLELSALVAKTFSTAGQQLGLQLNF